MSTPRPATYIYKTERHVLDTDAGQRAVYEALLDAEHLAKANDSFGPLAVIDRLIETTQWLLWLSVEQRKLVWARARYVPWKVICKELGCARPTAWRRWRHALTIIVVELNGQPPRIQDGTAASRNVT